MTRTEKALKATLQEMEEVSKATQAIWKTADAEDRETTEDEKAEVEKNLREIDHLRAKKDELEEAVAVEKRVHESAKAMGNGLGDEGHKPDIQVVSNRPRTPGEEFINSPAFKRIQDQIAASGGASTTFSTGAVPISGPLAAKGTLLEGVGAPGAGSGGGLIPVPQVVPGVVETLFQPLNVADVLGSGQTNTSTIRYVVEGTATSGADGVAEANAKPESTLGLSTVDESVKKIATSLVVSDEMLEDAAQIQSYINGRLTLFIRIDEERQILRGGGTEELAGIVGRSGVTTWARGTVDNNAVALFKAMNGQRGSTFLEPDAIVMHPTNWQATRLLTDTAGQFFGGGPFLGPYGGPQGPTPASGQVQGPTDTLWNKPVILTAGIGLGTALVGNFRTAAMLFRRGGVTVEATNSHSDYFTKNLVAIRAEERLALAVYRPAAFTVVSGLS